MKARAPGKIVLTGAYAVLEGAPAVVAAVSRYAVADSTLGDDEPSREVLCALQAGDFPSGNAPHVSVNELYEGTNKLGLGSSAAAVVAALLCANPSLADDPALLYRRAFAAHHTAQGGGSGVDIAASVYGGIVRFQRAGGAGEPQVVPVTLPSAIHLTPYFSGVSVRTSELLAKVRAFSTQNFEAYRSRMNALCTASMQCASISGIDAPVYLDAVHAYADALAALGQDADVPIVPATFARLRAAAGRSVFVGAGAGGGDLGVLVGIDPPAPEFDVLASYLGFTRLTFTIGAPGATLFAA